MKTFSKIMLIGLVSFLAPVMMVKADKTAIPKKSPNESLFRLKFNHAQYIWKMALDAANYSLGKKSNYGTREQIVSRYYWDTPNFDVKQDVINLYESFVPAAFDDIKRLLVVYVALIKKRSLDENQAIKFSPFSKIAVSKWGYAGYQSNFSSKALEINFGQLAYWLSRRDIDIMAVPLKVE